MYAFVDQPVERLCNGGRFLLWATRAWGRSMVQNICPQIALARGFSAVTALRALPDFHLAMALLDEKAREPLAFAPLHDPMINEDEAILIGLWRDLARGNEARLAATLSLMAEDGAAHSISQAMAAVVARMLAVGFDLTDLSRETLKEPK